MKYEVAVFIRYSRGGEIRNSRQGVKVTDIGFETLSRRGRGDRGVIT
jgi:hypothetical protein